jgi:glycosyltransferase involved in cell wall biosynthesis
MAEPTFSFIIPTRGKPEPLRRLCESIRAYTRRLDELEIVLVIDDDDQATCQFEFPGLSIRKVEGPPHRSMSALNTAGYNASTGRYVALLNDDVILRTPSWDDQVIDVYRGYPDGIVLVHVNDAIFRETLCTFPFLTRAFCELAGGICPDGYLRYYIDNHIHNVFDLLAALGHHRRIFMADVVFEHLNLTPTKQGYEYVVEPGVHATDSRRFVELSPERKRLVLTAAELIDCHVHSRNRRVWADKLEPLNDTEAIRYATQPRLRSPGRSICANSSVTVAVLSADLRSADAQRCIERIKTHTADYDLVIVGNNRSSGQDRARERNRLLEFCRTDYLVLMDDDVLVEKGWLEGLTRALGPQVGVVTPVHKDLGGSLSYAGIVLQPDDSGDSSPALNIGQQPQRIQTLSGAVILIDMHRCGHVRMDEVSSGHFVDIDYGLRIWEEGCSVVCTPWTQVVHAGWGAAPRESGQSAALIEAQRERWRSSWVETRRIEALRQGVWRDLPEFVEIARLKAEIDSLLVAPDSLSNDDFLSRFQCMIEDLHAQPALKTYAAVKARAAFQDGTAPADDPRVCAWAVLLEEIAPPPVAVPDPLPPAEQIFSDRPSLEPLSLDPIAPGLGAALKRLGRTLPHLYSLRPRILINRGANLFDPDYYRTSYPDIAAQSVHPFLHFLTSGAYEGRNPHPLFDTLFYLRTYPDVAAAGVNPLGHFLKQGAAERRRPHPLFDSAFYLDRYSDVRKSGMNPLVHYVLYGAAEGRQPSAWFQPDYYLDHCGERQQAAGNPLLHFLLADPQQRGDPHPHFNCEYYLRQNPGVGTTGMNPLVHYLLFGARAGRRPSAELWAQ